MVTDVQSLTNQTALSQKPSQGSNELGGDAFLKLLTTQLANQDPTSPMENTEFIAQLAQFSSLEGITNLNKSLENLLAMNQTSNAANAVSLIGKEVRFSTKAIDGDGELTYRIPEDANKVTIKFTDKEGRTHTVKGLTGKKDTWNTVDLSQDRNLKPGESYEFEIFAEGQDGNSLPVVASSFSEVVGVDYSGNSPVVQMRDGSRASTADVLEIRMMAPAVKEDVKPQVESTEEQNEGEG